MLTDDQLTRFVQNHYTDEMLASLEAAVNKGQEVMSPADTTKGETEDQVISPEFLKPLIAAEKDRRGLIQCPSS